MVLYQTIHLSKQSYVISTILVEGYGDYEGIFCENGRFGEEGCVVEDREYAILLDISGGRLPISCVEDFGVQDVTCFDIHPHLPKSIMRV